MREGGGQISSKLALRNFMKSLNGNRQQMGSKPSLSLTEDIYANLVILATACVSYWSPGVCLGHLGGLVAF